MSVRSVVYGATAVLLTSGVFGGTAAAQQPDDEWSVSEAEIEAARSALLFQSDDVLEFTLFADFNSIRRRDRDDDAPERPGLLHFDEDGAEATVSLKLQTRGLWRRDARNCAFPPLWLDLDKDDDAIVGTVFEGQNRLKLYVPCRPGNDGYERYIWAEYVIYQAYNELTDLSFRARPARVTYVDTSGEDDPFTSNAVILEHKEQLAARNGAVPIDLQNFHPGRGSQEDAALMEMFNYAVGMTDYSIYGLHNVEPIRLMDGTLVPVAYDFDWSGTVNARYAAPDPQLPISNVRQRTYQGFCRDVDYAAIFQRFVDRRPAMIAAVEEFDELDEDRRERIVEYWEQFFEMAADPGRHGRILRDCQEIPG